MIERMESAMKTSDWALIQTLYECRNITRAAAQLYISQPTLTKRLRAIEEELGVVIALRGKRGVTFTPEGEYLAVKATQFLSLMDEVNRHLTELKEEPSGTSASGRPTPWPASPCPDCCNTIRNPTRGSALRSPPV